MNLQKSMCNKVKFLPMAALVQAVSILMTEYPNLSALDDGHSFTVASLQKG